ncbi:MAG: glycosyltransferase family 4 protein [bacterium]|nr:glycosyltransferase family 4 protein [bacterium]
MDITFVLPGSFRSGGIRVTVEMANHLLNYGYNVRIACRVSPLLSIAGIKDILRKFVFKLTGIENNSWIQDFKGKIDTYTDLNKLDFKKNEIVVAVGSFTIDDVYHLNKDVKKIRYCHGFNEQLKDLMESVWSLPMKTIAVSPNLIPELQKFGINDPIDVVPNGVNAGEYYTEDFPREGIGTIYSGLYKKAPEDTINLLNAIHKKWPSVPLYVFSSDKKPEQLDDNIYWRYPSIEKSRELYNRSKIWLITSRSEGFCLPIIEALLCGSAIISTNHDTVSNLITHEQNGLIVPIGDNDAFMNNIEVLLHDETKRERLVKNGSDSMKEFTWEKAVAKMDSVLKSL